MKASMRRVIEGIGVEAQPERPSRRRQTAPMLELLPPRPPELSWPDYLHCLLQIASEIEHSLMVQYLYAAYSLGGDQVPLKHRSRVEEWRSTLLLIAREEMGHLLTVQNLRCLLGAPITFEREDYPWDTPFYPFPFRLEPLTIESLACYVYAEMPPDVETHGRSKRRMEKRYRQFQKHDQERIVATARKLAHGSPHTVGRIYGYILDILKDTSLIPDSCFNPATLTRQASFADWGRNYQPAPRYVDAEGTLIHASSQLGTRVIVEPMSTRTQAINAFTDVAGQGEAPHLGANNEEPSHFDRFLEIYQDFEKYVRGWTPTRDVPVNPTAGSLQKEQFQISASPARTWANLFNVRYRMLLTYLLRTYKLAPARVDEPNLRGMLIHRAFGEMYNLKTIAGLLMSLPATDDKKSRRAAAPFEMPYDLTLPETDADCWSVHRDLLTTAEALRQGLLANASDDGVRYLKTLGDIDAQAIQWIDQILAGMGVRKRHSA